MGIGGTGVCWPEGAGFLGIGCVAGGTDGNVGYAGVVGTGCDQIGAGPYDGGGNCGPDLGEFICGIGGNVDHGLGDSGCGCIGQFGEDMVGIGVVDGDNIGVVIAGANRFSQSASRLQPSGHARHPVP